MKTNHLITSALLALGLVSVAQASGSFGTTNVCYITGSTAFRANVFSAVTNGVFTEKGTAVVLEPSTATGSTGAYNAYGHIGGVPYVLSFNFTGSEAGIAALEGSTITYTVPKHAIPTSPASGVATLAGTPSPTGFLAPGTGGATKVTASPDLAFADTSQAVSLSATKTALFDNGIVAVIPFEWVKGKMTTASASWTHLVNVTQPQLVPLMGNGTVNASFFTGTNSDTDQVYLVGRNEGSGTRVNTTLDTFYGVTVPVNQWAPTNSSYVSGVLTVGTAGNIVSQGGLAFIANEGFESGGGVAATLTYDSTGWGVTLGYLGIGDANTAITGGGTKLTLDGVPENDETIIEGSYSFWGHEHLYGKPSQTSSTVGGIVADAMTGIYTTELGTANEGLGASSTAAGGLEAQFSSPTAIGGNEVNPAGTQSTALDPAVMSADKPSDSGYPTQQ